VRRKLFAELTQLAKHFADVLGVDDAKRDRPRTPCDRCSRDFRRRHVAAEKDRAPPHRRGRSPDQRRPDHVAATHRGGDEYQWSAVRDRHRLYCRNDERFYDRGRHVLLGDGQPPAVPVVADIPQKRHDRLLEKRRRTDQGSAPPEQFVEPAGIEGLNAVERGLDEALIGIHPGCRLHGTAVFRGPIACDELREVARRQRCNAANPAPCGDGGVEQAETLDVGVGVQALATGGPGGCDGAISTFPNTEYVV